MECKNSSPIIIPQTHQNKSHEISIIQPSACDKESSRISLKSTGVKGKASISIRVSLCFPFFDLSRFGNSQKMYIPGIWFIKFPSKFRVLLKFEALLPRSLEIIIIKPIENFPTFFSNPMRPRRRNLRDDKRYQLFHHPGFSWEPPGKYAN